MRKNIVAGNWKMNKNIQEGILLSKELVNALQSQDANCEVIIIPPFTHLTSIADSLKDSKIQLGAQNCSDKELGAYTGEISAEMIQSTGAKYVLVGHSERRQYFSESSEQLKNKILLALKTGLTPIFCFGEKLEEREQDRHFEVVKQQLEEALFTFTNEEFSKLILAYEPVWAIGTGKTASSEQAQEIHHFVRNTIKDKFGAEAAENTSILYGGSCKASNAKELFSNPDVDGGLIGGASLISADFIGIISAF